MADIEPIGSPLVRVSFTGNDCRGFSGRPDGLPDWTCPPKRTVQSAGLRAGSCGPFLFGCNSAQGARRLHGSTKLAGAGRLWTMCCAPLTSIVAQSLCMAVILPPEMRRPDGYRI